MASRGQWFRYTFGTSWRQYARKGPRIEVPRKDLLHYFRVGDSVYPDAEGKLTDEREQGRPIGLVIGHRVAEDEDITIIALYTDAEYGCLIK